MSSDGCSQQPCQNTTSCIPCGGTPYTETLYGDDVVAAPPTLTLPASNNLMRDSMQSALTSPQSALRYLAHWSHSTDSEAVFTPQYTSQSSGDMLIDDVGGSVDHAGNPDNEIVQGQ